MSGVRSSCDALATKSRRTSSRRRSSVMSWKTATAPVRSPRSGSARRAPASVRCVRARSASSRATGSSVAARLGEDRVDVGVAHGLEQPAALDLAADVEQLAQARVREQDRAAACRPRARPRPSPRARPRAALRRGSPRASSTAAARRPARSRARSARARDRPCAARARRADRRPPPWRPGARRRAAGGGTATRTPGAGRAPIPRRSRSRRGRSRARARSAARPH